jgi:hypothetical protein
MPLRYARTTKARRPRFRAVPYQDKRDPTRLIAEQGRKSIKRALANALRLFRATLPIKAMADKIAGRDLAGAADLVNVATLQHDLKAVFAAIADIYKAAGAHGAGEVTYGLDKARQRVRVRKDHYLASYHASSNPYLASSVVRKDTSTFGGQPQPPRPDKFAFDLYTQEVMQALSDYQDSFITAMTDDVRQTVFAAIAAGVKDGTDPEEVAASIRDVIGLNDRQAIAVENYRAALEDNSSSSLYYTLADDAGDEEIQAAIDTGIALDASRIDELVHDYVERSLDYRADMIAQTESNRAANMGLQDSYKQAVATGVFPHEAVRQFWMLASEEKACDECIDIAADAIDGIPLSETFDGGDEPYDAPPAHPNCMCNLEMRTNLDLVSIGEDEQEEAA